MRYSRAALYGGILDADFKHIVKIRSNSNNYKSRILVEGLYTRIENSSLIEVCIIPQENAVLL